MNATENVQAYIEAIGKTIANKRTQMGLSQSDLAEKTGVTTNTISNIERGQHPGYISNVITLCLYLDISLDTILFSQKRYGVTVYPDELEEKMDKLSVEARALVVKQTELLVDHLLKIL